MLISFTFDNVLSFRDKTTLDLTPTRGKKYPKHVLTHPGDKRVKALRFAAIFGANASGKSNLVKALEHLRKVVFSGERSNSKELTGVRFALDDGSAKKPQSFDVSFSVGESLYTYRISVTDVRITREELFLERGTKSLPVFRRVNEEPIEVFPEFGEQEKRTGVEMLLKGIRPSETVLSFCQQRGSPAVDQACAWLSEQFCPISDAPSLESLIRTSPEFLSFLSYGISKTDAGIQSVQLKKEAKRILPPDPSKVQEISDFFSGAQPLPMSLMKTAFRELGAIEGIRINAKTGEIEISAFAFAHRGAGGKSYDFTKQQESDGTVHVLDLLRFCFLARSNDFTFIVDELDASLHSLLAVWYLKLFSQECNKTGTRSQIIFTSHDTAILNPQPIRDDEIWFTEKGDDGASKLFPLTDFDLPDNLNRRKSYLEGRFGAVPYLICPEDEE
ncbi:MAG: ATP-binding protein [Candidatus Brocadiia bacterium]